MFRRVANINLFPVERSRPPKPWSPNRHRFFRQYHKTHNSARRCLGRWKTWHCVEKQVFAQRFDKSIRCDDRLRIQPQKSSRWLIQRFWQSFLPSTTPAVVSLVFRCLRENVRCNIQQGNVLATLMEILFGHHGGFLLQMRVARLAHRRIICINRRKPTMVDLRI